MPPFCHSAEEVDLPCPALAVPLPSAPPPARPGALIPSSWRISKTISSRSSGIATPYFWYALASALGPRPRARKLAFGFWWILNVVPPSTDISNAAKEFVFTLGAAATRPADERMEAATAAVVNESLMMVVRGEKEATGR